MAVQDPRPIAARKAAEDEKADEESALAAKRGETWVSRSLHSAAELNADGRRILWEYETGKHRAADIVSAVHPA